MISVQFGKGQGFADKAGQPLTQGIVPAFHMSCLATLLAHAAMCLLGEHFLVCFPEIAEGQTLLVLSGDLVPQAPAGLCAAVADDKGYQLSCAATDGRPQPAFARLLEHKRPQFVQFQHVIRFSGQQSVLEIGQSVHDFSDPAGDRLPGNVEDALQPTHASALLVSPHNCFLLAFWVNTLGLQNTVGTAIFTVVLGTPAFVGAVLDNVRATALAAAVGDGFLDHFSPPVLEFWPDPYDTTSLTFLPLPKLYLGIA